MQLFTSVHNKGLDIREIKIADRLSIGWIELGQDKPGGEGGWTRVGHDHVQVVFAESAIIFPIDFVWDS